jgi:hypothetical protein
MTAFVRGQHFNDVALFERLEALFVEKIDDALGPDLVTMFTAHSGWAAHMVDECITKKLQTPRTFKMFKKYHDAFYEHIAVNLIRNADEINLKGTILVLVSGNVTHLKLRANMRLM